jgi:hypothetical protein
MRHLIISIALLCVACTPEPPGDVVDTEAHSSDVDAADAIVATLDAPNERDDVEGPEDTSVESEVQGDALGPDPEVPTSFFVHVASHPALASASEPFWADQATLMTDPVQLPHLDIRALVSSESGTWVGTSGGLYLRDLESGFYTLQPYPTAGFIGVQDISKGTNSLGHRAVLFDGWVQWVTGSQVMPEALPVDDQTLRAVALNAGEVWLGGDAGVHRFDGALEAPLEGVPGPVRDLVLSADGALWVASAQGIYRVLNGVIESMDTTDAHALLALDAGVWSGDSDGVTWFPFEGASQRYTAGIEERDCDAQLGGTGCTECLDCESLSDAVACDICGDGRCGKVETASHCPGDCGLPTGDVRSLDFWDGALAMGHAVGATVLHLDEAGQALRTDHYAGARWLPGQQGQAVAFVAGDLEIGTEAGLSRITWVERRLSEDAESLEALLDAHFWRMGGFVTTVASLDDANSPQQWTVTDTDNDGLFTQMQVGAWCYAYAATGEEIFYTKARKAMDTLQLLVDIPAKDFQVEGMAPGFVARSLVRDDEGGVFEDKLGRDNWHRVSWTDDHDYYWKDDTSSDELAGHFFGYPLFFDLCAKGDAERTALAARARSMTRYIMDGGYRLIDLDGQQTLHGHWQPERLASAVDGLEACEASLEWCGDSWFGGGWLNSLEMLGQLLATYHMTGDVSFYEAYEVLIAEHRYDEVGMPHRQTATITCPTQMNHSDHELAMLAYHTLIRYEADPQRRAQWIDGLRFFMDWERVERNPLWGAFSALLVGEGLVDVEAALQSFREMPVVQQNWAVDNHHRRDAVDWLNDRFGSPQFDRVFAYDEIRPLWWNGNFHVKANGGDGRQMLGPMAWLLPYYAFRYAGVLSD